MTATGIVSIKNNLSETNQFPLNVIGPKGPNAFVGSHQVLFQGATGLVATSYGIPGVTVGRLRTGVYGVRHPPVKHAQIWPAIQAPSGMSYDVSLRGMSGRPYQAVSGYAEIEISRMENAPVVTGTNPSTLVRPQNPPTGAVLDLFWYASTSDPLGY
jgi:hypothetical protein